LSAGGYLPVKTGIFVKEFPQAPICTTLTDKTHCMKPVFRAFLGTAVLLLAMSFQIIKTQLSVTIRNELGNIEEGVKVQLFETEEDYKAEKNVAAEGYTDKKGIVKFKDLKATSYYVIAAKDDKDNSGGGEQTGKLEENRINKVTIVIQ
jgi:uncharacterized protein (DUF2141 family)